MNPALKQRLDALEAANAIRSYRSRLKAQIATRQVTVDQLTDILMNPPEQIESMRVYELVKAVPGVGKSKTARVLKVARLTASSTVAGAGRQRLESICDQLARWR